MKRCLIILLLLCLYGALGESPQTALDYPGQAGEKAEFFINQSGELLMTDGGKALVYREGRWLKADEPALTSPYAVRQEANLTRVLKGGKVLYETESMLNALCPVDDETAFAIKGTNLYRVDMTTGLEQALYKIDTPNQERDWFNRIAVSDTALYAINTQARWIYRVDKAWALDNAGEALNLLMTALDDHSSLLQSAEACLREQYPAFSLGIQRMAEAKARTALLSGEAGADLLAVDAAFYEQLARAGRLTDLRGVPAMADHWDTAWYDMRALCEVDGALAGLPLWTNALQLLVSPEAMDRISIQLPDAGWTYDDFLSLAQSLRAEGAPGKGGLSICYARTQIAAPDGTSAYIPFLLPQIAALCHDGRVPYGDPRVLHAMEVWKTCLDEGLMRDENVSPEEIDYAGVLLPELVPANWIHLWPGDERLCYPSFAEDLPCTPARAVFLAVNAAGGKADKALAFMDGYMKTGAAGQDFLLDHAVNLTAFSEPLALGSMRTPTPNREAHYARTLMGARRDTLTLEEYLMMNDVFERFLHGELDAAACAGLWQARADMMRGE